MLRFNEVLHNERLRRAVIPLLAVLVAASVLLTPALARADAQDSKHTQATSVPDLAASAPAVASLKVSPYAKANRQRTEASKAANTSTMLFSARRPLRATGRGQRQ